MTDIEETGVRLSGKLPMFVGFFTIAVLIFGIGTWAVAARIDGAVVDELRVSEAEMSAAWERTDPELSGRQRLQTASEADARTDEALEQARRFLSVAALTAVILAAVAVLLAAMRFSSAQRDLIAILKAFGAESGEVMRAITLLLLWLVTLVVLLQRS